ncbi:hypothetical protein FPJ27_07885 [Burkholderia sp. MS455]|nr:hypothetical protein FPJ27_07885 [Burkholderia sp. MS455]
MPEFPATAHKSRSHSNVGIFVHEAYHPQGLSQYDNDLMLRTETTCHGYAIHLCLNFFARSLCPALQRPVWRGASGYEEWPPMGLSGLFRPLPATIPGIAD